MDNETAVVLFIFNRPKLTKQVFNVIAKHAPKKMFIIADGPKNDNDLADCHEAREIVNSINWDCSLETDFSDINLGCRRRISSGLNWVFSQVNEAIILEDDCLPDMSFFSFCSTLLKNYSCDERVWVISGNNFQDGQSRGDGSYYFSRYPHCWGWATWKRAWQNYDDSLSNWHAIQDLRVFQSILDDDAEIKYWMGIFNQLITTRMPDTWAYYWLYSCWVNSALTILPNVNLVSNIGFGEASTHTKNSQSLFANIPTESLKKIRHPNFLVRDKIADAYTFDNVYGGATIQARRNLLKRIQKKVLSILALRA